MKVMKGETMAVWHPSRVDFVVLARSDAEDFVASGPDDRVATGAAVEIDALGFLEEPYAHLEAEVVRSERTDGADVSGVERVVVIEATTRMNSDGSVCSAL